MLAREHSMHGSHAGSKTCLSLPITSKVICRGQRCYMALLTDLGLIPCLNRNYMLHDNLKEELDHPPKIKGM